MKLLKSLLTITIIVVLVFSLAACSNAQTTEVETETYPALSFVYGDADNDGSLSILDATCIQRVLADYTVANFNKEAAMVSDGKELTIIDATLIQRKLVNLIDRFPVEEAVVQPTEPEPTEAPMTEEAEMKMVINDTPVTVEWEDNESVAALKEAVKNDPLTIQMSMYGGFEQVGSLGMTLPRNDTRITTDPGDVILYSGDQMVVFYGSNTWAYTRLGRITDKTTEELTELLSNGSVTITLSY